MPNPLIDQGSLNRIRASVTWQDFPGLNVTAPYLNKSGITLSLDSDSTTFLPTKTGAVISLEPYVMATLVMGLLKTQSLAARYKQQLETNSALGDGVVRPDSVAHPPYDLINCALINPRELGFSGEDASYTIVARGYYLVNSDLWL